MCRNHNSSYCTRGPRGKRDHLTLRITGLIGAAAEGPIGIGGLVLIVLFVLLFC